MIYLQKIDFQNPEREKWRKMNFVYSFFAVLIFFVAGKFRYGKINREGGSDIALLAMMTIAVIIAGYFAIAGITAILGS